MTADIQQGRPERLAGEGGPLTGCLIVSGLPGAGKTTVSRLVAEQLPRSARLDGDVVNEMIVNGGVGPVSEPADEAARQLLLRARNLCSLAGNFAAAGFLPVIDHVVPDRDVVGLMIGELRVRPVLFVVLAPSLEVCRERNATRAEETRIDYDVSPLDRQMRGELRDVGWWLDSAGQTPSQTAAEILAHAPARARIA